MKEKPRVWLIRRSSYDEAGQRIHDTLESLGIPIIETIYVSTGCPDSTPAITTEDGERYEGIIRCILFCSQFEEVEQAA